MVFFTFPPWCLQTAGSVSAKHVLTAALLLLARRVNGRPPGDCYTNCKPNLKIAQARALPHGRTAEPTRAIVSAGRRLHWS